MECGSWLFLGPPRLRERPQVSEAHEPEMDECSTHVDCSLRWTGCLASDSYHWMALPIRNPQQPVRSQLKSQAPEHAYGRIHTPEVVDRGRDFRRLVRSERQHGKQSKAAATDEIPETDMPAQNCERRDSPVNGVSVMAAKMSSQSLSSSIVDLPVILGLPANSQHRERRFRIPLNCCLQREDCRSNRKS